MPGEPNIEVELVDGREALGLVVLMPADDGNVMVDIRAMKIDKLEAAVLFMRLGRELKRQHDEEATDAG